MKIIRTGTVSSKIKRGDQVVFIAGREYARYDSAGKRTPFRGKVIEVDARNGKVKVEGAMLMKKHQKPVPQLNREGGIREQEAWVDVSNVALVDPDTGKPTRVKIEIRDGKKVRVARSGTVVPIANVFGKKEPKTDKDKEEKTEE